MKNDSIEFATVFKDRGGFFYEFGYVPSDQPELSHDFVIKVSRLSSYEKFRSDFLKQCCVPLDFLNKNDGTYL